MLKYILSSQYRLSSFIITLLYLWFYDYMYRTYMFPTWNYMGVHYNEILPEFYPTYLIGGALPVLLYKGLRNIASGFSIMIYFFGILPCYHSIVTLDSLSYSSFWGYVFAFLISGCLFFLTDSWYLLRKPFLTKNKYRVSVRTVEIIAVVMLLSLVATYGSQMSFVNFFTDSEELYAKRAENSGLSVFTLVLYFQQWLTNGFMPFLLVIYLRRRSMIKIAVTFFAYVVVFMINLQKSTFLMPIILTLLYIIIKHRPSAVRNYFYAGLTIIVTTISAVLLHYLPTSTVAFGVAAIFIMRTVCVEGWLCDIYVPFFENHPYTWFSHINIINYLTNSYPYADSIGRTVTDGGQNANAFFMLMDGVAGGGILGVYIVALIFILVKGVLNSICLKFDKNLCIIIFLPAIISLINVSLFTAMLTCGILILYLLFVYVDAPELTVMKN